ncbi:response regulator [Spongiimicrobium sp. 3-5]|uniref:response regulator n=1 Tax=Spongiimicrobium sp. 3-5 TaxID=3332596 RepID=UPI00398086D7
MKSVLLIEDDMALRENTQELMELAGYKVLTAANGQIGIDLALANKPDVIICDIMMPEVDGYGVLRELSKNEDTRSIPFIFLSAKTEHKEVRKGMDLGADDYLTKPFDEEDLISAIESRLAKAKLIATLNPQAQLEISEKCELRNLNELKNFFDDNGTLFKFKNGDAVYQEGANSNKVYLILKGVAKCHKIDEEGKELITSLHRADDFLGFSSFVENIPYQETATAVEDLEMAGISKDELKSILEQNHAVALELIGLLSENLAEIKEQLLQMAYGSVRKKTAQTLIQFADIMNNDKEGPIRISRNDLASVAGIATESLIRTLSNFKKQGLIAIEERNIRILDLKTLRSLH